VIFALPVAGYNLASVVRQAYKSKGKKQAKTGEQNNTTMVVETPSRKTPLPNFAYFDTVRYWYLLFESQCGELSYETLS
jgi:hypothetical protein